MTLSAINTELTNGVMHLVLDRPPLNPINRTMEQELAFVLKSLRGNEEVRCVVIRGGGDRAFSVGADIHELDDRGTNPNPETPAALAEHCSWLLERLPVPTAAAINGHCLGGGLELALCADVRFAHSESSLGFPEVRIGLFPGMGGPLRLKTLVGASIAKEMILSGEPMSGARAAEVGLVNGVAPDPLKRALEWAEAVSQGGPFAVRAAKTVINRASLPSMDALLAEQMEWGRVWSSQDRSIGMEAFRAKQRPKFTGR